MAALTRVLKNKRTHGLMTAESDKKPFWGQWEDQEGKGELDWEKLNELSQPLFEEAKAYKAKTMIVPMTEEQERLVMAATRIGGHFAGVNKLFELIIGPDKKDTQQKEDTQ